MIRLVDVKKKYENFETDISMSVEKGYVTGLVGRNGAGKSTTFKLILGLIKAESGTIEVFGNPAYKMGVCEREQMGVVLSDAWFSRILSVNDISHILAGIYHGFSKEEYFNLCSRFDIPLNKPIKEFSTGMKAKIKIISAISHNPRLLILDEPTQGLDVVAREDIIDILRNFMEDGERSILISSHISSDLEGFCDNIYMIDNGKIIMHEDTDVLVSEYGVIKVTKEQYENLDKRYILRVVEEKYGCSCLTNNRQYYIENYPDIVVENGNIDEMIISVIKGEKL